MKYEEYEVVGVDRGGKHEYMMLKTLEYRRKVKAGRARIDEIVLPVEMKVTQRMKIFPDCGGRVRSGEKLRGVMVLVDYEEVETGRFLSQDDNPLGEEKKVILVEREVQNEM